VNNQYAKTKKQLSFIVREKRKAIGLSQEDFAEEAQIDRTYVSQIERGVANPSLSVLCKIADVFNIEISELLK
jgi:transcriptional regulator with XRE-family HTH domain